MPIVGAFARDGMGAPAHDLDAALAAPGLDSGEASRRWVSGAVALGCRSDASLDHPEPSGRHGPVAAVWGRIDNRSELQAALDQPAAPKPTDAALLGRAYRRWGDDALDHVVGDFCAVLWDGETGRLLLGRDPVGRRPMVYHDSGAVLRFATEPRALLALHDVPRDLDEARMAEWLALLPRSPGASFFRGIRVVPPGHVLVADRHGSRLHRYWRPENVPPLRLRRDQDYEEAMRAALDDAVACRLPAAGPVATTLSAGLDSSSVTVLAARHLARQGRSLIAYTAVPQAGFGPAQHHPERLCDEGPLAAEVARRWPNVEHVPVPGDAMPLLDAMAANIRLRNAPTVGATNSIWGEAIMDDAARRGVSTVLVGNAGNMTVSYAGLLLLPSLLLHGRLAALARHAAALHGAGASWGAVFRRCVGPFLTPRQLDAIRRVTGRGRERDLYDFSCINPNFARETGVERQFRAHGLDSGLAVGADSRKHRLLAVGALDPGIYTAAAIRRFGVTLADPTADKRVIELCLSLPDEQFMRPGQPRSLILRAMDGLLPPDLLANRRRGLQSADWGLTVRTALPDMRAELERLQASPLARRCLDLPRMVRCVETFPADDWWNPRFPHAELYLGVMRGLAAGYFMRRLESGSVS